MNHPILQNCNYNISSDHDYLGQERGYNGVANPISSNDYLSSLRQNGSGHLTSLSTASALPISAAAKLNSHLYHDSHFNSTSSPLLGPLDVTNGAGSGTSSLSSAIAYSTTLPKPCSSNFPSSTQLLHAWTTSNMADMHRGSGHAGIRNGGLSPSVPYNSGNSMIGPPLPIPRPLIDQYASAGFNTTAHRQSFPPTVGIHDLGRYNTAPGVFRGDHFATPYYPSHPIHMTAMSPLKTSAQSRGQEGPTFEKTEVIHTITTADRRPVTPDIEAAIQKGFFKVEGKWTCYRRNYFAVACAFHVKRAAMDGRYFVERSGRIESVSKFAISISAKTSSVNDQDTEPRGLVQHTPKRDKATETIPTKQVIIPTPADSGYDNFGLSSHAYGLSHSGAIGYYDGHGRTQSQPPPTSHTFDRIQFQKATANNGKRRAQQQYFHVVVEVLADTGSPGIEHWLTVARRQSDQMVVRGRSPGHYKDNMRRDNSSSMGPDSSSGHGGEGYSGSTSMAPMLSNQHHTNGMDWQPTRSNGHMYGGTDYRQVSSINYSPQSGSSATCWTNTPTESDSDMAQGSMSASGLKPVSNISGVIYNLNESSYQSQRAVALPNTQQKTLNEEDDFHYGSSYSSPHSAHDKMSDDSTDYMVNTHVKAVYAA